MNRFLVAVFVVSLVGCTTTYKQADQSKPFATAQFEKSYGNYNYGKQALTQGRHQYYFKVDANGCSNPERIGIFATGSLGGNAISKRLAADQEITIVSVISLREPVSYNEVEINACLSALRFTPESGQNYSLKAQFKALDSCNLVVELAGASEKKVPFENEGVCSAQQLSDLYKELERQYPLL